MQKRFRLGATYFFVASIISGFLATYVHADITSIAKNDPYPMFTAVDPLVDRLLIRDKVCRLRNEYNYRDAKSCAMISASVFEQTAVTGKNIKGESIYRRVPVQLGDLTGRWGLIPLMMGTLPQGATLPAQLQSAKVAIFGAAAPTPYNVDPNQRCGYLSFPLKYVKRGLRVSWSADFVCGFGLNIEGGVSSLRQNVFDLPAPWCADPLCDTIGTPTPSMDYQWIDLTAFEINPPSNELPIFQTTLTDCVVNCVPCQNIMGVSTTAIQQNLSRPFATIACQMGLDIDSYSGVSSDEWRFNLYWHRFLEYYRDSYEWAHVAVIPLLMLSGSVSPGIVKDEHKAFQPYFGNNGHPAIGGTAGLYLDFADTLQVGAEFSYTYFFGKDYTDLRIPNSHYQTTVYPFFTNARVKPGQNNSFSLRALAYHFLDSLSICVQYNKVEHKPDSIRLLTLDPVGAFLPDELEAVSEWTNSNLNASATYDILPNFGVGFLWQAPVRQRNSYKATTLMFTAYGFF
jgi:hypothetical protein